MQGFPSPKWYKLHLREIQSTQTWISQERKQWSSCSSIDTGLLNGALDVKELQIKSLPFIWIFVLTAWTVVDFCCCKGVRIYERENLKNVHCWAGSRDKMFISSTQPFEDLDLNFFCEISNFSYPQLG